MLRKYFYVKLPLFTPEQMGNAEWLRLFLLIFAVALTIVGFIVPFFSPAQFFSLSLFVIDLLSFLAIAGALLLVHRGYVRGAAIGVTLFLLIAVTYANIDAFVNPNLLSFFVLIPFAGLVLGKRAMFLCALLSAISIGLIFYVKWAGYSPRYPTPQTIWTDLILYFFVLALNTLLLTANLRSSEHSAQIAQQAMTELVSANQELQASQQKLQEAYEKEKELSELKSRFVSMASHEFRTPLTTICLYTESLMAYRHKLTEEQINQRLGKIQSQVQHLSEITEDVLQLARLQARRMEFHPDQLDLDELCRSILADLQSLPEATARLIYRCTEPLPMAYVDKRLTRQLISNLVGNALKYSPAEKRVTITLEYTATTFVLTVADEGIGIPAADLPYLFEPFHRAVNVGSIAGTGLGLVIVKEAVELHGGTIAVASEVNRGTTFTVKLPLLTAADEATPALQSESPATDDDPLTHTI